MTIKKLSCIIIALPLFILILVLTTAQGGDIAAKLAKEYQLKAAYLLNFARFTTWPDKAFADPQAPFVISILGDNPFGNSLEPLTTRKIKNRAIELQYFTDSKKIKPCQMLFINKSERHSLPSILERCKGMSIFTISDIKGFIQLGGMLEFITIKGHLRFSINFAQVQKHGLKIDAQLLALATEVIKENP